MAINTLLPVVCGVKCSLTIVTTQLGTWLSIVSAELKPTTPAPTTVMRVMLLLVSINAIVNYFSNYQTPFKLDKK